MCFLGLCRCCCGRSDRVAVCIYLLPPALPALSAHGLPPALCQPGCQLPRAPAPARRPAAHRQRHHPSAGGLDWRARMTSGQRRDSPDTFAQPPSPPPRFQWLTDFSPDRQIPLLRLRFLFSHSFIFNILILLFVCFLSILTDSCKTEKLPFFYWILFFNEPCKIACGWYLAAKECPEKQQLKRKKRKPAQPILNLDDVKTLNLIADFSSAEMRTALLFWLPVAT